MVYDRNSSIYGPSAKFVSIAFAMKPKLPDVNQKWSECTTSISKLQNAFEKPEITGIKADVVMGNTEDDVSHQEVLYKPLMPIMTNPPDKTSDLSMEHFIYLTLSSRKHHIKLHFKDIETVSKTIQCINKFSDEFNSLYDHPTVFFTADILSGPGKRNETPAINADQFIETCLENIECENDETSVLSGFSEMLPQKYAFALGWTTDPRALSGYSKDDVENMRDVIERHELLSRSKGVVLMVNARNLFKRLDAFDDLLIEIPCIQLLAFTTKNEPPISKFQIDKIKLHFEENGSESQIGFDCESSALIGGLYFDYSLRVSSIFWNFQNFLSGRYKANYQKSVEAPQI